MIRIKTWMALVDIFGTMLCLIVGNFSYQAMTHKDWGVAIERSCFQAIAILILLFEFKMTLWFNP